MFLFWFCLPEESILQYKAMHVAHYKDNIPKSHKSSPALAQKNAQLQQQL